MADRQPVTNVCFTPMRDFFREPRERKIIRVGIAYLVGGWLVMQMADVIFPAMGLPAWSIALMLGILAAGFPLALVTQLGVRYHTARH